MVLVCIQDEIQLPMRKEDSSLDVVMCWPFGESFDSVDHVLFNIVTSKFIDELVVIDFFVGGVLNCVGIDNDTLLDCCLLVLFDLLFGDLVFALHNDYKLK